MDPALKSALQRLEGGHRASAGLRATVTAAMAAATVAETAAPATASRAFWNRPWVRVAAAACLLLGIGTAGKLAWDHHIRSQEETFVVSHRDFLELAVSTFGESEPRLVQTFPSNLNPAEIGKRMSAALGYQVVVPDGSATGWTVTTAGLTELGSGPMAYVYFRNQTRSAVMLVFPPKPSMASGVKFDVRLLGHRVGGVATPTGLHTFVTRPCEEGATDDLSDLVDLVARNSFFAQ